LTVFYGFPGIQNFGQMKTGIELKDCFLGLFSEDGL